MTLLATSLIIVSVTIGPEPLPASRGGTIPGSPCSTASSALNASAMMLRPDEGSFSSGSRGGASMLASARGSTETEGGAADPDDGKSMSDAYGGAAGIPARRSSSVGTRVESWY